MASAAVDGALELAEENVEVVLDEVRAAVAAGRSAVAPVLASSHLSWLAMAAPWSQKLSTFACEAADGAAEHVLDAPQVRPYLMSDGGNVEFVEIDGPVVYLRLQVSGTAICKCHVALPCRASWCGAMVRCRGALSTVGGDSGRWRRQWLWVTGGGWRRLLIGVYMICCRVRAAAARRR